MCHLQFVPPTSGTVAKCESIQDLLPEVEICFEMLAPGSSALYCIKLLTFNFDQIIVGNL